MVRVNYDIPDDLYRKMQHYPVNWRILIINGIKGSLERMDKDPNRIVNFGYISNIEDIKKYDKRKAKR